MSFVFGRPLKEGNLMREDKEVTDQKHRNAYKRAWRNRRNYEEHFNAAQRSKILWHKAAAECVARELMS